MADSDPSSAPIPNPAPDQPADQAPNPAPGLSAVGMFAGTPHADLAAIPGGELGERCGIELTECTPERVAARMPVVGNRQPFGLLHGGANAVLAETVGSVHATMLAGEGRIAVGVELNCTHHRSATSGTVTALSTALHVGRQVSTFHITIRDDAGRATCTARLTCLTRSAQPPSPTATDQRSDTVR